MPPTRAVTPDSLGAWLLKAAPTGGALHEVAGSGFATVTTRCVRPSYRTALIAPGQPVLLWVSGRDPSCPAGVHAAGWTTGAVEDSPDGLVMPLRLSPVSPLVRREALVADPLLASLEVLRMPAGSNPSYLDVAQYDALRAAFPQTDRGDGRDVRCA